ncbi:MAG TPA: acylneuraminate cytidylyltransferase family protein [Rhizomicrobium sp.]|nr:acylneuraminate cytidylyltransferase family protein [Rhizomicrobium sp.]
MMRGRPVIAVVPARGDSKGIPRKNLYRLGGVALGMRAVQLARSVPAVDRVYVSTDDTELYALAQKDGSATPSPRPAELASDKSRTIAVMQHLLEERVLSADAIVLLLQPTSPLRSQADLEAVLKLLDDNWDEADAVISVGKIDGPHPYKAQVIENGALRSLIGLDAAVPRQSLPATYLPNGAFYLGKLDVLLQEDTFMPRRSLAFVMPEIASINLDGPLDMLLLEAVLAKGLFTLDDGASTLEPPEGKAP